MTTVLTSANLNHSIKHYLAVTIITSVLLAPIAQSQINADETFTLNLKNADIHSLIETVSLRTGTNFIVDPRVKATVTVISSKPINSNELYKIFLSILDVHGYAAVTVGETTRIVPTATGVQNPVPLLPEKPTDGQRTNEQPTNEQTASSDQLSTHVFYVENIPVQQLVEALAPLVPQSASISAEANSNAVVITDRASNIARLENIIRLLDRSN